MKTPYTVLLVLLVAQCPVLHFSASAGSAKWRPAALISGIVSNPTGEVQQRLIGTLKAAQAVRMQIRVSEASLGTGSKVRFVSAKDGQSQALDAAQLQMWGNRSAMFNGDEVRLEIILAPGDTAVSVRIEQILAGHTGVRWMTNTAAAEILAGCGLKWNGIMLAIPELYFF